MWSEEGKVERGVCYVLCAGVVLSDGVVLGEEFGCFG